MKKFILAAAVAATLVVPAAASANVERYQEQTGSLTVKINEYPLVHTFNDVVANPCDDGSFTVTGSRDVGGVIEDVKGTLNGNQVAFESTYTGSNYASEIGYQWGAKGTLGKPIPGWDSMGTPFTVTVTAHMESSNYKNHGEYVKAMGGGSDAAHSCIGMPIKPSK